jgi:hypothetical protein
MENPASSRYASSDMPISAWSSTIMQQGRVITSDLLSSKTAKAPPEESPGGAFAGQMKRNYHQMNTLTLRGNPLNHKG